MWTLSQMIGLGILCSFSVADIQFRSVSAELLILTGTVAAGYQILIKPTDALLVAGGGIVGLVFLGISRITRQALGYGDSLAILILGIFLGMWGVMEVLAGTFLLLAVVSGPILMRRKMSRRYRLPFYPFLTAGYAIALCLGNPL